VVASADRLRAERFLAERVVPNFREWICGQSPRHRAQAGMVRRRLCRIGTDSVPVSAWMQTELDQECVQTANLKAEAKKQTREIDRLSAELEHAQRPW
jgi:hypothetical protein